MVTKNVLRQIEGYTEIEQEVVACRKHGINYRAQRGETEKIVARLHPEKLQLKVARILEETAASKTLRLVSRDQSLPPFQAGQYVNLFAEINGIRTSRPYSISSSPKQTAYYDITIHRIEEGFVSDYLLDQIKVGDYLESTAPAGNFYYNPLFHGTKLVFLAGGSGITPFMSMIREAIDAGLDRDISLIYGNRSEEDILFHHELLNLATENKKFSYHLVLSDPAEDYQGLTGYINKEIIEQIVKSGQIDTYYICGPQAMYDYCIPELGKLEIPTRKIRKEMFSSHANITANPAWPCDINASQVFSVHIQGSRTIEARAGEPLLVSLERNGLQVKAGCRSGECSQCRIKLLSGKVFQPSEVLLRKSDRQFGYIHSCKAYPLQDLEIML